MAQRLRFSTGDENIVHALLNQYLETPEDEDNPFVNTETKNERNRIWKEWEGYVRSSVGYDISGYQGTNSLT